jgi:hypothetical protein
MIATLILAALLSLPAPGDSVCVTEHGARYHRLDAPHCAGVAVARAEADSAGFTPCRICYAIRKAKPRPWDRLRKVKP